MKLAGAVGLATAAGSGRRTSRQPTLTPLSIPGTMSRRGTSLDSYYRFHLQSWLMDRSDSYHVRWWWWTGSQVFNHCRDAEAPEDPIWAIFSISPWRPILTNKYAYLFLFFHWSICSVTLASSKKIQCFVSSLSLSTVNLFFIYTNQRDNLQGKYRCYYIYWSHTGGYLSIRIWAYWSKNIDVLGHDV
jgi:hypothetical protein